MKKDKIATLGFDFTPLCTQLHVQTKASDDLTFKKNVLFFPAQDKNIAGISLLIRLSVSYLWGDYKLLELKLLLQDRLQYVNSD